MSWFPLAGCRLLGKCNYYYYYCFKPLFYSLFKLTTSPSQSDNSSKSSEQSSTTIGTEVVLIPPVSLQNPDRQTDGYSTMNGISSAHLWYIRSIIHIIITSCHSRYALHIHFHTKDKGSRTQTQYFNLPHNHTDSQCQWIVLNIVHTGRQLWDTELTHLLIGTQRHRRKCDPKIQ